MLEKTTRMNLLYDFYGALLTGRQREFMELYYYDDLSLAEIAEQFDVSRQAVHDNIRRAEAQLLEYEQKLRLLEKYQYRQQLEQEAAKLIQQLPAAHGDKELLLQVVHLLVRDGDSESDE
jgi:predicted DNA-binding protein YlxM (UPF0122 family)